MRFVAPPETGSITLACGVLTVEDGHVTVPEDAPASDLASLFANGFLPASHDAAPLDLTPEQVASEPHEG